MDATLCRICGETTKVLWTRPHAEGTKRTRQCPRGHRQTTIQPPEHFHLNSSRRDVRGG